MSWKVIDTGVASAEAIMARDEQLLEELRDEPVLHFYEWAQPAATYGYFFNPRAMLLTSEGLDLARRVTGGGLTFHITDFAFSLALPASHPSFSQHAVLENYRFVNSRIITALNKIFPATYQMLAQGAGGIPSFCMAQETKYDVMCDGKKAVGAAQRTKRWGYLHQGFVSLALPERCFLERHLPQATVEQILSMTYAPVSQSQLQEVRIAMKRAIQEVFTQ